MDQPGGSTIGFDLASALPSVKVDAAPVPWR